MKKKRISLQERVDSLLVSFRIEGIIIPPAEAYAMVQELMERKKNRKKGLSLASSSSLNKPGRQ